jgi:hypothetical protein
MAKWRRTVTESAETAPEAEVETTAPGRQDRQTWQCLVDRANRLAEATWAWSGRHARLLVWIGLALCILAPLRLTSEPVHVTREGVRHELEQKEDIHNLYYAAANASWRDAPRWWVGSWIYPDVGYYRPLTSMLFLFEYRAFGDNFTAYNRISQILHLANVALLYLLTVSLFRAHRRTRAFIGLVAAYYFTSTDSSMFFAVNRVIEWWPAQNDVMSLTFGLLSLLLLDLHLHRPRWTLLAGSLLCLFLSIASKEMGFIVAPIALALVAQRRLLGGGPWRAPVVLVTFLTAFMWFFRRIVVPNHWGPALFRSLILDRIVTTWGGPPALMAKAGILWPAVSGVVLTGITVLGLRRRWPVLWIAALCAVAICAVIQIIEPEGTFAILLFYPDQVRLCSTVLYLLAVALFFRYARVEPALFTGAALWLAYLPILQYGGGKHYYYWPSAFNALADAAFVVCLWRWAGELKERANWEAQPGFLQPKSERENAAVS